VVADVDECDAIGSDHKNDTVLVRETGSETLGEGALQAMRPQLGSIRVLDDQDHDCVYGVGQIGWRERKEVGRF